MLYLGLPFSVSLGKDVLVKFLDCTSPHLHIRY